jgi:hypothetical protein
MVQPKPFPAKTLSRDHQTAAIMQLWFSQAWHSWLLPAAWLSLADKLSAQTQSFHGHWALRYDPATQQQTLL